MPRFWAGQQSMVPAISLLVVLTIPVGAVPPLLAQQQLRLHQAPFNITVGVPPQWLAREDAALAQLKNDSEAWLDSSSLDALRRAFASRQIAILFAASDPAQPFNSANLNAVMDGNVSRRRFADASDDVLASMMAGGCTSFQAAYREAGGSGTCLRHERRVIAGRVAAVQYQEAVIPAQNVHNMRVVAFIPSDGVLFTLSLTWTASAYDLNTAQAVLRSLVVP